MDRRPSFLERWPSGVVLLLLLTAALLPLGLVLAWAARQNIQETNLALVESADQQGVAAELAVEGLIARNALALRIAANGALAGRGIPARPRQDRSACPRQSQNSSGSATMPAS